MADTPSQPSPEILEKLRQLREELAQKAAQQAPKSADTLAWQQSNAFKRIYPRANGGQIKATQSDPEIDALFQEPSLTMGERFRKYVAPNVIEGLNSGLNGMFPMRKLAKTAFEKGVYQPVANFVTKNANDLSDADVQGRAEEYRRLKDMELRNKYGIRQLPVEYDLSKFKRRLEPNSFPNPDNPIDVPKSLERDWTELLMQPKASGGQVDMDRMRLELMNGGGKAKAKRHNFVKHKRGEKVDGYDVGEKINNYGSYASSGIDDVEEGIHRVPMSAFEVTHPNKLFYAKNDIEHVHRLAEQIKHNKYMDPLLVAMDKKGAYVLEGGHRLGAAHLLGMKEIPAMIGHEPEDYANGGITHAHQLDIEERPL